MKDTSGTKARVLVAALRPWLRDPGGAEPSRDLPERRTAFPRLVDGARFMRPVLSPGGESEWKERHIQSHPPIHAGAHAQPQDNGPPEDSSDGGISLAISGHEVSRGKCGDSLIVPVEQRGRPDGLHDSEARASDGSLLLWQGESERIRTANVLDSLSPLVAVSTRPAKQFEEVQAAPAVISKVMLLAAKRLWKLRASQPSQEVHRGLEFTDTFAVTGERHFAAGTLFGSS